MMRPGKMRYHDADMNQQTGLQFSVAPCCRVSIIHHSCRIPRGRRKKR